MKWVSTFKFVPYRIELLHNSFKDFQGKRNHPCGSVCHFSPRENEMDQRADETGKEELHKEWLDAIGVKYNM